jgi:hypothetical protein
VTLSLEGLAVLAGVLLAFSVESYGESRDDQERVARMLVALDAELDVNADRLSSRIRADEEELNTIDSLFAAVVLPAEGVTPSVVDVTRAIERIGPKVGGLTLVEDQGIRQSILEYSRMLSHETAAQENGVDFWNDHLSPYYFEYGSLGRFLAADRLGLDAPPPVSGAFVRSRHFANLLGERRAIVNRLKNARVALGVQVDSLRHLLR